MHRLFLILLLLTPGLVHAEELRVLTAGAYKAVLLEMLPVIEKETGHKLIIANETAGGIVQKLRANEAFDLVVLPPANADSLGPLLGPARALARVGIGIAVREGAPKPDISNAAGIRAAVLAAAHPAWIDPAAGGSSGIYLAKLWERWGIADTLKPRAVLVNGGLVADKIRSGEADMAFQQLSELTNVPGVVVLGPLPADIQSYTVYAGAIPARSAKDVAAKQVLAVLTGPQAAMVLKAKGMDVP